MPELSVRIETLAPMRVAWVRAFGASPETAAWSQLNAWARPAGLLDDPAAHPVFGFNNPAPTGEGQEYGYELWIAIGPEVRPPDGIGAKDFEGGLYAVTTCRVGPDMPQAWRALLRWVQASPRKWRRTGQELERIANPREVSEGAAVDLYLPLEG